MYKNWLHLVFWHIRHHRFKHGVPVTVSTKFLVSCLDIDMVNLVKLYSVCHFRGIFNVNLLTTHYDINFTDRD